MSKLSFTDQLEQRARRIAAAHTGRDSDDAIITGVINEIAFVLDQIDQARAFDESQHRSLIRLECYIDTDLMQMEARTPRYSPYRFPEREKLQRRLMTVAFQHVRHGKERFERLGDLHRELRRLLQKIDQLDA